MGRGFLSGIFWGGILSLVVLFVSSQTLERQSLSFPKPNAAEVEVPGGSEFNQARPETDPVVPEADTRPAGDVATGVAVPEEEADTPPALDTAALEVPVPATTQDAPETLGDAPAEVDDVPAEDTTSETPVETTTADPLVTPETPAAAPETVTEEVAAPDAPAAEPEDNTQPLIIIHETPAKDAETEVAALPETEEAPEQPSQSSAPAVSSQSEAPAVPSAPATSEEVDLPWLKSLQAEQAINDGPGAPSLPEVSSEPSLPPVGSEDAPEQPEQPLITIIPRDEVEEAVADALEAADDPVEPSSSEEEIITLVVPDEAEEEPAPRSSGTLPVVRRLGDSSASEIAVEDDVDAETETGTETTEDASEDTTDVATGPALQVFGSDFEGADGEPLMSIVLVQLGDAALPVEVLEALPSHVSFAVDASSPAATSIARAYRAAGREVVMIPSLPAGAAPQDIEQALSANFERVPEAVAVMDVTGASFQSDRDAVAQVVDVVSDSGHGLITFPRGLNTAHQQAQRAGVPTGLIFRNLDAASETQDQILRTLDRASFRARQDAGVILVGSTGSTMLTALSEWALGNEAGNVTIAPVSVALGG